MISAINRWQSEIRAPADGTQPSSTFGVLVTADAVAHTKGAWTDCILAADWASFVGDAFWIEVTFLSIGSSATISRVLGDIGIDTGGGYTSIIDNLSAAYASAWVSGSRGITYEFPLRIPNGAKIGCRIQGSVAGQTARVEIVVRGNPTHPGLVRAGTFVRTFGANTASSDGVAVASGAATEGAWTSIATSADDLWWWELGMALNDAAINAAGMTLDIGKGPAASQVPIAVGFHFSLAGTESIGKIADGYPYDVPSGTDIWVRWQVQGGEVGQSAIVYAVGGNYELPNAATATGTVTIVGVAAANGKTVEIYAKDSDGIIERIGTTTTGGGTGAFSLGCPDTTRSYFAKYEDGTDVGCSLEGTPGVDALDISIGGSGGGGESVDPVITTISQPTASGDPLVISLYDAASALALYVLTCKDRSDGKRLTIYNPIDGAGNDGFVHPFAGRSTVTGSGTSGDPYIFTIYRRGRWPTGIDIDVRAQVVDASGNEANA